MENDDNTAGSEGKGTIIISKLSENVSIMCKHTELTSGDLTTGELGDVEQMNTASGANITECSADNQETLKDTSPPCPTVSSDIPESENRI